MSKPIRTPLSQEQLEDARRLHDIYRRRVQESRDDPSKPTLTQTEVGELCEWKSPQSTVSQYMNGRVALNLEALLKLSRALNFEPEEVSPSLAKGLKRSHIEHKRIVWPDDERLTEPYYPVSETENDCASEKSFPMEIPLDLATAAKVGMHSIMEAWSESSSDAVQLEQLAKEIPLTLRIRLANEAISHIKGPRADDLARSVVGIFHNAREVLGLLDSILEAAAYDAVDLEEIEAITTLVKKRRNEKVHGVGVHHRKET